MTSVTFRPSLSSPFVSDECQSPLPLKLLLIIVPATVYCKNMALWLVNACLFESKYPFKYMCVYMYPYYSLMFHRFLERTVWVVFINLINTVIGNRYCSSEGAGLFIKRHNYLRSINSCNSCIGDIYHRVNDSSSNLSLI